MKFECQSTVQKNNILEIKERVSMQTHMFQSEWAIWIIATTKPTRKISRSQIATGSYKILFSKFYIITLV